MTSKETHIYPYLCIISYIYLFQLTVFATISILFNSKFRTCWLLHRKIYAFFFTITCFTGKFGASGTRLLDEMWSFSELLGTVLNLRGKSTSIPWPRWFKIVIVPEWGLFKLSNIVFHTDHTNSACCSFTYLRKKIPIIMIHSNLVE